MLEKVDNQWRRGPRQPEMSEGRMGGQELSFVQKKVEAKKNYLIFQNVTHASKTNKCNVLGIYKRQIMYPFTDFSGRTEICCDFFNFGVVLLCGGPTVPCSMPWHWLIYGQIARHLNFFLKVTLTQFALRRNIWSKRFTTFVPNFIQIKRSKKSNKSR